MCSVQRSVDPAGASPAMAEVVTMQAAYLYDVNNQRIGKVANGTVDRY